VEIYFEILVGIEKEQYIPAEIHCHNGFQRYLLKSFPGKHFSILPFFTKTF
jgi:hypothetical protein